MPFQARHCCQRDEQSLSVTAHQSEIGEGLFCSSPLKRFWDEPLIQATACLLPAPATLLGTTEGRGTWWDLVRPQGSPSYDARTPACGQLRSGNPHQELRTGRAAAANRAVTLGLATCAGPRRPARRAPGGPGSQGCWGLSGKIFFSRTLCWLMRPEPMVPRAVGRNLGQIQPHRGRRGPRETLASISWPPVTCACYTRTGTRHGAQRSGCLELARGGWGVWGSLGECSKTDCGGRRTHV